MVPGRALSAGFFSVMSEPSRVDCPPGPSKWWIRPVVPTNWASGTEVPGKAPAA